MSNALNEMPGILSKKKRGIAHRIISKYLRRDAGSGVVIYILRRVLALIPVVAVVLLVTFLLMHAGTSDPAAILSGDAATPERISAVRKNLGLDRPLHEQFLIYVSRILQGDLGVSLYTTMPVTVMIAQKLPPTLSLAFTSMALAIAIGIPMGVAAARHAGKWIDHIIMGLSVIGIAFPVYLTGYLLILGVSLNVQFIPIGGFAPLSSGLLRHIRYLMLPAFTLGLALAALIARMTRTSMIEALNSDYVRTARAKGVSNFVVTWVHALKNASVPIATVIGVGIASLIGGVVITETVFVIPGLGRLTVDSIINRDYPVIQGVIIFFSFVYLFVNLLIDILYTVLDPRIRY